MAINWAALGVVAAVSLAVAVLLVVLVSLALVGLSARDDGGETGEPRHPTPVGRMTAAACLLVAAVIVLYGLAVLAF
jgi:heme/copper-type cytochrome/quinol oxidase subunit 2